MKERRTENRLLCAELVELVWKDAAGQTCRRLANLEDISSSGINLQSDVAIRAGESIMVRYRDRDLAGVVRYCHRQELGYFLGVRLETSCNWSNFRPEHLLDPAELVAKAG
ncbi:MAG TPA: PilZ domain-containing protein [Bryobacteraceae bacterium]|nr:PilZ domain-containing protein [Bryobacteraceae bacterium]